MLRNGFLILLLAFGLFSCRTTNLLVDNGGRDSIRVSDSVFLPDSSYQYRIRRDDKITISLWGEDALSVGSTYGIYNSNEVYGKWLMVDAAGKVEIPRIGSFHVQDMSIIELKDTLRKRYAEWIRNPVVDVKVLNRQITVMGEVRDPQVITIDKERNTLLEMIARCKGFEFYANPKYIKVLRQVGHDVHVTNIDLTASGQISLRNVDLYPGDIVVVPSKKYKEFDRRVSTIIPFTTTINAAAIFIGLF